MDLTATRRSLFSLHRPSAALGVGAWAGFLAAVTFLLLALPVLWQVVDAAQEAGLEQANRAARIVQEDLAYGRLPTAATLEDSGVDHVDVDGWDSRRSISAPRCRGVSSPRRAPSPTPTARRQSTRTRARPGHRLCRRGGRRVVTAVWLTQRSHVPVQRVLLVVFLLATFVAHRHRDCHGPVAPADLGD